MSLLSKFPEGNAIIYCEGAYGTTNGKTAHGLVRRTERYIVHSVVDSSLVGKDAGEVLDNKKKGIPILANLEDATELARKNGTTISYLVIGLTPDGGRLSQEAREDIITAITLGLNIDSGLHDFLSEDKYLYNLAKKYKIKIRDIRKPPPLKDLHFFSGKIEQVKSLKIAILGTDSAVGKRTTAWILLDALRNCGYATELIGTGQTSWMQGVKYGTIFDSLINDFVSGEIEHAVWSAWVGKQPEVILIEGQGSLMNPAYPGGFEILAAGRPDLIIVQHPPARKEYDGFPGYKLHPLEKQIQVIELLSSKPVIAVTINHERINIKQIKAVCDEIAKKTKLPTFDVLINGAIDLVKVIETYLQNTKKKK